MKKRGIVAGILFFFLVMFCFCFSAIAQAAEGGKDVGVLVAKVIMGFSLSLGLAGSAIGLAIAFSALLGVVRKTFSRTLPLPLCPQPRVFIP